MRTDDDTRAAAFAEAKQTDSDEKYSARDGARHVNNNGLLRSGTTRRAVTFAMVSAASGAALVCAAFAWALWLCSRFLLPWLVSLVVGSAAPSPPVYSDFLGRVPSASRVARRDHLLRDHLLLSSLTAPRPRPRLPGSRLR